MSTTLECALSARRLSVLHKWLQPIVHYFKRTNVAAPYMELYCQLSATDNIVLPSQQFRRRRAICVVRDRMITSRESITHPKKSVRSKEERRESTLRADVTHGSSELNRSQATNGSTLSIGYIHWETECKIKRKKRLPCKYRRRNNIWLLKATSLRQATSYDTSSRYDRMTSVRFTY